MHPGARPASPLSLLAGAGSLTLQLALMRTGIRPRVDGWRRAARIVLRGEASTFVLSAFGLDGRSDQPDPLAPSTLEQTQEHIRRRLRAFLENEPGTHLRILRGTDEDRIEPSAHPNFALAFEPAEWGGWGGRGGSQSERSRGMTNVAGARFVAPHHWPQTPEVPPPDSRPDSPLLRIVCRARASGECDIWMNCNHAGIDGVPAQEILTRLEAAWGAAGPVTFPTPQAFEPFAAPRDCPGRPGLAEVQTFLDFGPLMAWRKAQNAHLPEPMTLGAAILWRLANHTHFAGAHLGSTVEVPTIGRLARGVGVVVVGPPAPKQADGLAAFVRDFNAQVERTRRRESTGCRTLDAAARVSPRLAGHLLLHSLKTRPRAFGTLALTMLKDARVFGAPIAQAGHERGFLAIGDVGLPSIGGRRVGCICVKGPRNRIAAYPALFQAILGS